MMPKTWEYSWPGQTYSLTPPEHITELEKRSKLI